VTIFLEQDYLRSDLAGTPPKPPTPRPGETPAEALRRVQWQKDEIDLAINREILAALLRSDIEVKGDYNADAIAVDRSRRRGQRQRLVPQSGRPPPSGPPPGAAQRRTPGGRPDCHARPGPGHRLWAPACLLDCGLVTWHPVGRQSYYHLAVTELEELLRAAEQVLARTGEAVELCPNYGTAAGATPAPADRPDDAA
jgi:hypothetical protein